MEDVLTHKKNHTNFVIGIIAFFGIIYSLISLINHSRFRTYALDLGLYNNQLYEYAHFRMSNYSILNFAYPGALSDHFDLLMPLYSPLYWIFGSYTLLIVQILAILFGGYGIFIYFKERTDKKFLPEIAMVHFFVLWGIYSALSFDFHENVVGTMFVPWLLHFFDKRHYKLSTLFFILILISKENMALWMAFIAIGLIVLNIKDKSKLKVASIYAILAFIYFLMVVNIIMPSIGTISSQRSYAHFQYSALGNNIWEAIQTIFSKPLDVLKLLFINPDKHNPNGDGVKAELHWVVLFSGGYALLFRPQYLIMLIPIYAQKLCSDDLTRWSLNSQYSIEFVPILSIALFTLLMKIKTQQKTMILATNLTLLTAFTTYSKIEQRKGYYHPDNSMFYDKVHYDRNFSISKVNNALKLIPKDAIVCAQTVLVPHLSNREFIYVYPDINNADYIALLNQNIFSGEQDDYNKKLECLLVSPFWETIYNQNSTYIFKRKKGISIASLITNANGKVIKFRAGIKASNGNIVSLQDNKLIANRNWVGPWEKFQFNIYNKRKMNLLSFRFKYVSSESQLIADKDYALEWESFTIHVLPDNKFAFQAYTGKYVKPNLQNNNILEATSDTISDKEFFEIIPE